MQSSSSILLASALSVLFSCCITSGSFAAQPSRAENNGALPLADASNTTPLPDSAPAVQSWGTRHFALFAAQGGGFISGEWTGGKTENDPIHGGYLNATFNFNFMPNGQYTEVVRVGNAIAFRAQGNYSVQPGRASFDPSYTNVVSFVPSQSQFTPGMENIVRFFPVPNDEPSSYYVGWSPLQGGGLLTLKDRSQGSEADMWGLKRP